VGRGAGDWATRQQNSVTDFDWRHCLQPAKKKNKGRTNMAMVRMARSLCECLLLGQEVERWCV
jgi:hypothetical protein